MNGAHRLRLDQAARRARAIRSFLTGLAVAGAISATGLAFYLLVIGTPLQDWTVLLIVSVALLIRQLVRSERTAGMILVAASLVVSSSWQIVSAVAHDHHWPVHQLSVVASIGNWLPWAIGACVAVVIVIDIRSGELTWPPWRLSGRDSAESG